MEADINYHVDEEKTSLCEEVQTQDTDGEKLLSKIELGLAYSWEKVSNLGVLSMLIAARSDFEVLPVENEASLIEAEKDYEYDILFGILKSEVEEQEIFLNFIHKEVIVLHQEICFNENFESDLQNVKEKLLAAEKSLVKMYGQLLDFKQQAYKSGSCLASILHCSWSEANTDSCGNIDLRSSDARLKEDTMGHSEGTLRILERSLARELDLEKRLFVSEHYKEGLNLELQNVDPILSINEEELSSLLKRYFQADNASGLFAAMAKELMESFQFDQALSLRDQVNALEEKLWESDAQLQKAKASIATSQRQEKLLHFKLIKYKNTIMDLKDKLINTEIKAANAEAQSNLLAETNLELNMEIDLLKSSETDKAFCLEEKLKVSDTQLEHAKSSYEAIEEQQTMLYSALVDMKNLIEDLKIKVSVAEKRAENAESKCALLTDTNRELNDELIEMRYRLEYLEESLHKAERAKVSAASEVSTTSKVISDLVMRLALERERLQIEVSVLKKENRILGKKCWETNQPSNGHSACDETAKENISLRFPGKEDFETSTASIKAENSAAEAAYPGTDSELSGLTDNETDVGSDSVPVRTIEAGQLSHRHAYVALLLLLTAVVVMYIYQVE